MSRFTAQRPAFGRPAQPAEAPPGGAAIGPLERRAAQVREAAALVGHLPPAGGAFHAIMTGRYDLADFLKRLPKARGPIDELRIATLSYNGRNLAAMFDLLDSGQAKSLTLLCSSFFKSHNVELFAETVEGFRGRGQRVAAARSHAKVITARWPDYRLVVEGSANLRTNSNIEQVALIADGGLHDWHGAWIDQLIAAHECDNDREGEHV